MLPSASRSIRTRTYIRYGYFLGTCDFDPGPGTYDLTSPGGEDVFVSKLDSTGSFVWAARLGGASTDIARGVASSAAGNVHTVGYFLGTADFDPGPGIYELTADSADAFVSKLGPSTPVRARQGARRHDARADSFRYPHTLVAERLLGFRAVRLLRRVAGILVEPLLVRLLGRRRRFHRRSAATRDGRVLPRRSARTAGVEGSYGTDSSGNERATGTVVCEPVHVPDCSP